MLAPRGVPGPGGGGCSWGGACSGGSAPGGVPSGDPQEWLLECILVYNEIYMPSSWLELPDRCVLSVQTLACAVTHALK